MKKKADVDVIGIETVEKTLEMWAESLRRHNFEGMAEIAEACVKMLKKSLQ